MSSTEVNVDKRPIRRWLKNPKNKAINSPRDLEVDQIGAESFSGTATEEGVSEVVHFIRLVQKGQNKRLSPCPPPKKVHSQAQEMGKHSHVQLWLQGLTMALVF